MTKYAYMSFRKAQRLRNLPKFSIVATAIIITKIKATHCAEWIALSFFRVPSLALRMTFSYVIPISEKWNKKVKNKACEVFEVGSLVFLNDSHQKQA